MEVPLKVASSFCDVNINEPGVIPQHSEKTGCEASKPKGVAAACQCAGKDCLGSSDTGSQ